MAQQHDPYGASGPAPRQGPPTPPGRHHPATRAPVPGWLANLPYVFVLCGVGAGLIVVALDHFRRGSMIIGVSLAIGALARLLLDNVGMLQVRGKWVDVLLMGLAAAAMMIVAFVAKGIAT